MPVGETWKSLDRVQGKYSISSLGRCRNEKTGHLMKADKVSRGGHLRYRLYSASGELVRVFAHVAVLETFIGPRPEGFDACHIDGNPENNALCNLRWGTRSENVLDSVNHGTHPYGRRNNCPRGHPLEEWNLTDKSIRNGTRECISCARAMAYANYKMITDKETRNRMCDSYFMKRIEEEHVSWTRTEA